MARPAQQRWIAADYVRARAADVVGMPEVAAKQYAQVLDAMPNDPVIAIRAYRQAIVAGDRPLASKAAAILAAQRSLPPDARLLLMADAISRKDWAAAGIEVDRVAEEQVFAFAVPALRAWIAQGSGKGDPLALLGSRETGALAASASPYDAEQRMLLQFARGNDRDGLDAFRALGLQPGPRATRLRVAVAAALARERQWDTALTVLTGDDPAITAARARIEAKRPLGGAIDTPSAGIAELLVRVAVDINRERVTPLALTLARIATFLAPENPETWLVTAELLSGSGQPAAALVAIQQVRPDDPFAAAARTLRVQYLLRSGEKEGALAAAKASVAVPQANASDWTRLGQLLAELGQNREAADAFAKAIALSGDDEDLWTLYLMRGGALEQAEDWPGAKAALEKAYALKPDEPAVLNYLGYAQLERRENIDAARALIEKASRMEPDDAAITDSLGWAYYLKGDLPKAIETIERAVLGQPGDPAINEHLGDVYWTAGRRVEARYAWRAALVHADAADAVRIARKIDAGLDESTAAP